MVISLSFSCIDESQLKPVVPFSLLHGNGAKVWMLEEIELPSGKIVIQQINQNKTTYTLFQDQSFVIQKLMHFGTANGQKGGFNCYVDKGDTIFRMDIKNKGKELFNVLHLSNEKFEIQSVKSRKIFRLNVYSSPF
jgi:hypothetical protein